MEKSHEPVIRTTGVTGVDPTSINGKIGHAIQKMAVRRRQTKAKTDLPLQTITPKNKEEPNPDFIGVDGSYSFLFTISGVHLAIVRVCAVEYTSGVEGKSTAVRYVIKNTYTREETVLVAEDTELLEGQNPVLQRLAKMSGGSPEAHRETVNRLRTYKEQELALELASNSKGKIICLDGSLADIPQKIAHDDPSVKVSLLPDLLDICTKNGNMLIGVSKDSSTNSFCPTVTDEEYLSDLKVDCPSFIKVPDSFQKKHAHSLKGQVYFARFHSDAPKWFRVDIGVPLDKPADVFSAVSSYCRSPVCTGYPYPMLEAHRLAVVIRQYRQLYEDMALEHAQKNGIPAQRALRCLTHVEGKARGAFHEWLDQVTRDA